MQFYLLQAEIATWQAKNFPNSTTNEPFHGIVEELGELVAARLARRQAFEDLEDPTRAIEESKDAVADMTIFALDYCNRNGWKISDILSGNGIDANDFYELQDEAYGCRSIDRPYQTLIINIGHLAHARLKSSQGIRGDKELFTKMTRHAIGEILVNLGLICCRAGWDYEEIVVETWKKVRQRDWTANRVTGQAAPIEKAIALPTITDRAKVAISAMFQLPAATRSTMPYESN